VRVARHGRSVKLFMLFNVGGEKPVLLVFPPIRRGGVLK
jgi:hypothetical protein